ncbi:MAG: hypothetical protein OWQ54_05250 [Sulfolobaceae archaeon]|nr:hypothetical protein [Sulfolobaceae archaeon]
MIRVYHYKSLPWISLVLLSVSASLSSGLYITINRVTYYPYFQYPFISFLLTFIAFALLVLSDRRLLILTPITALGYLNPTIVSYILMIPALLKVKRFPRFLTALLSAIDASGISWIIIRIVFGVNTYFSVPMLIFTQGLAYAIPIVLWLGIPFSLIKERAFSMKGNKNGSIYLIVPTFLSLLIPTLPILHIINPARIPETTDWIYYHGWLVDQVYHGWFFDTRPFFLIFLLGLSKVVGTWNASYYIMVLLSALYAFSAYELGESVVKGMGWLSAALAAISPMFMTFLYSGLDANLFSIAMMFLSLSLVLRKRKLWLATLLSYVALLSHVYAWAQLEAGVLSYFLFTLIAKRDINPYFIKYALFTSPIFIIGLGLILAGIFPAPITLMTFSATVSQLLILSWGSANNIIYYVLSILGLKYTPDLVKWIYAISILGLPFIGSSINIIIDLPLFLPAALALYSYNKRISIPVFLLLSIWSVYMSINTVPLKFV